MVKRRRKRRKRRKFKKMSMDSKQKSLMTLTLICLHKQLICKMITCRNLKSIANDSKKRKVV